MKALTGSVLLIALLSAAPVVAGDAEAGKARAAVCAACHGVEGKSVNPLWPNLAGQQEQYLIKQLKDFKSGSRNDPLMGPQAAALSDADIENLAAYFSSLK